MNNKIEIREQDFRKAREQSLTLGECWDKYIASATTDEERDYRRKEYRMAELLVE